MNKLIINLNKVKGLNSFDLINSPFFKNLLSEFLAKKSHILHINKSEEEIIKIFNFILLNRRNPLNKDEKETYLLFLDSFYDFYRIKERYLILNNNNYSHRELVKDFTRFSNLIINTYRDIYETILEGEQKIYRNLASGANAALLFKNENLLLPQSLSFLKDTPVLDSLVTQPPFFVKTKQNKRDGYFFLKNDPVNEENFDKNKTYAMLIKIYNKKGLIFVNDQYLSFIVALANLFEISPFKASDNIDFFVIFGTDNKSGTYYYLDENKYIGILDNSYGVDYFGYAKKMILTLFNLTMIKEKSLPIHGAGVKISKGNKEKTIVFLGDSGAGKSETLEQIKALYSNEYIVSPIFDDMGTFHIIDNEVYTSGTEIGAFVRLDDLDLSYSLESADRSIYFNIDEDNSRLVMPLVSFKTASSLFKVDAFFLADNFSNNGKKLLLFNNSKEALDEFIKGERIALNTTSEKGKVSTYLANPFGPMQEKEFVNTYINDYFDLLFKNKIPVGKLLTSLSFDKKRGPALAAQELINFFNNLS